MPINISAVSNFTDQELVHYVDNEAGRIAKDPDSSILLLRLLTDRLEALRDQMAGETARVRR